MTSLWRHSCEVTLAVIPCHCHPLCTPTRSDTIRHFCRVLAVKYLTFTFWISRLKLFRTYGPVCIKVYSFWGFYWSGTNKFVKLHQYSAENRSKRSTKIIFLKIEKKLIKRFYVFVSLNFHNVENAHKLRECFLYYSFMLNKIGEHIQNSPMPSECMCVRKGEGAPPYPTPSHRHRVSL